MNNYVIVIGRRIGAGGLETARRLSEKLGIRMYDKEILAEVAKKYGIRTEIMSKSDEKPSRRGLKALVDIFHGNESNVSQNDMLSDDAIFSMQSNVISKIAEEESCIFVGRCADYILRDNPNCLNVFITADIKPRASRIAEKEGIPVYEARQRIEKSEKKRADYYNYFTFKKWGDSASYDLCIDSEKVGGIDNVVEIIMMALRQRKLI